MTPTAPDPDEKPPWPLLGIYAVVTIIVMWAVLGELLPAIALGGVTALLLYLAFRLRKRREREAQAD